MAGKQPVRRQGGSLVELIITIAVLAILTAIGLPSFKSTMRTNRVASQGNALQAAINRRAPKRSASRTRILPSGVCSTASPGSGVTATCGGSFNTGWMAFDYNDATQNMANITVVKVFLPDANVNWTQVVATPIVFNNQGMATSTLPTGNPIPASSAPR